MRIPFPERLPINRVAIVAVVFFAIQRIEGTTLFFAIGCLVFILLSAFAFNIAGGLTRASGAYIFCYSTLVVLIGLGYKAFLGEPAQSNLVDPRTTIEVFDGGIAAMGVAAFLSRRFARRTGLLENILPESNMYRSAVGCLVVGVLADGLIGLLGQTGERLQAAFGQLNQLVPLGIIIGVMYEIRRSRGTRCINLPTLLGAAYFFVIGTLNFSKQGMLTPIFCWLLPVWAMQYRLSRAQILAGLLVLFVIFHYLVPFSQYGRSFIGEGQSYAQRAAVAIPLIENPEQTRQAYYEQEAVIPHTNLGAYYDAPQGFWDRLQFISTDDALIDLTDGGRVYGLSPVWAYFVNFVPRVIWHNKPAVRFGNLYAHELGGFNDEDTTTGISFSPTAEAYHLAKWRGVLLVAPLLWLMMFVTVDSLVGDIRRTPWGLLAMAMIAHSAPEAALAGPIGMSTFGVVIISFCALFATWVAPVVATAILGTGRSGQGSRTHSSPSTMSVGR